MRVRVRHDGDTLKLSLPEVCNVGFLKKRIADSIFDGDISKVRLSLNRNDEIGFQPELQTSNLRAVGIAGGDLIHLLPPDAPLPSAPELPVSVSPATYTPEAPSSTPTTGNSTQSTAEGPRAVSVDNPKAVDLTNMDQSTPPDDEMTDVEADTDVPATENLPLTLLRIFEEVRDAELSSHERLLYAVHAVMLESGFGVTGATNQSHALPCSVFAKRGLFNITYTLKTAAAAAGIECLLRCHTLGGFLVVYGAVGSSQAEEPKPSGHVHRTCLAVEEHIASPLEAAPGEATKDPVCFGLKNLRSLWTSVKDSLARRLLADVCLLAGLEPPPALQQLPEDLKLQCLHLLPAQGSSELAVSDVAGARQLRDDPSAAELSRAEVEALVAVGCTCKELRFVSENEELWRLLLLRCFGEPADAGRHSPGFCKVR
ncbi:hypothetical protein CYMTET_33084, partial [Cymbomonas tetramitiformis]